MKIIAISSGEGYKSEVPIVVRMFKEGLDVLHLRKPNFSEHLMEEYLNAIPDRFHNRIVLHAFHDLVKKYDIKGIHITKRHKKSWFKTFIRTFILKLKKPNLTVSTSCHSLSHLKRYSKRYDYVFLSPVFNSISKKKRYAGFSFAKIQEKLKKSGCNNVYALGGVSVNKVAKAKEMGFAGVVLLGSLWKDNDDPLSTFIETKQALKFNASVSGMKIKPVQLDI